MKHRRFDPFWIGTDIVAMLAAVIILSTRVDTLGRFMTRSTSAVGDINRMAGLTVFRPEGKFIPLENPVSLEDAQIIVFGDSFTQMACDSGAFHTRLQNALGAPAHHSPQNGTSYNNPLQMLLDKKPPCINAKLLIWIKAETNLVGELNPHNPAYYQAPYHRTRPAEADDTDLESATEDEPQKDLKTLLFDNSKLEYVVKTSFLTGKAYEIVANSRFLLLTETSPLAPKYSLFPKMLFYYRNVEAFEQPLEENKLDSLALYISTVNRKLEEMYGIILIFIPVPTKYTIYHDYADPESVYNDFLPLLCRKLNENGVYCLDLYPLFMSRRDEILYWSSDTHWNGKGLQLAVDATADLIRERGLFEKVRK